MNLTLYEIGSFYGDFLTNTTASILAAEICNCNGPSALLLCEAGYPLTAIPAMLGVAYDVPIINTTGGIIANNFSALLAGITVNNDFGVNATGESWLGICPIVPYYNFFYASPYQQGLISCSNWTYGGGNSSSTTYGVGLLPELAITTSFCNETNSLRCVCAAGLATPAPTNGLTLQPTIGPTLPPTFEASASIGPVVASGLLIPMALLLGIQQLVPKRAALFIEVLLLAFTAAIVPTAWFDPPTMGFPLGLSVIATMVALIIDLLGVLALL